MPLSDTTWVTLHEDLEFASPILQRMLELWQSKRRGDALPRRVDFSLEELGPHFGWIVLVDVERDPQRFRYRLIGTEIVELAGRDVTGRYFDELYAVDVAETATMSYRRVVSIGRPTRVSASLYHASRGHLTFEAVDLPLASDGRTVDMIMVRSVYDLVNR